LGNPKNITNKTFEEAAKTMNQSPMDAKRNARELLERVFSANKKALIRIGSLEADKPKRTKRWPL
jgi:hypothetical protein